MEQQAYVSPTTMWRATSEVPFLKETESGL